MEMNVEFHYGLVTVSHSAPFKNSLICKLPVINGVYATKIKKITEELQWLEH